MPLFSATDQLRVDVLNAFRILDTPPEPAFDRVAEMAAYICRTPIATITLVDKHRQWFKASVGLDIRQTAREIAFCNYTIRGDTYFQVTDASADPRFRDNPLVVGPPHLAFYVGIPLVAPGGHKIGALAVMDQRPRRLLRDKIAILEILAQQVMTYIDLRFRQEEMSEMLASRQSLMSQLERQTLHLRDAQRIANVGSWEMEIQSRRLRLSDQTYRMFGVRRIREPFRFTRFLNAIYVDDRNSVIEALEGSLKTSAPLDLVHRIVRSDGEVRFVHERAEVGYHPIHGNVLEGTIQDITEQRRSQEALELLHSSVERVQDIVMITDAEPINEPGPRIVFVNKAFEEQTGYSRAEILGKSPRFLQGAETQRSELDRIRNALIRRERVSTELINYRKNGEKFWSEFDIAPVITRNGTVTHFASVQRDVTQRKESERKIEELAFFDPLTRLPNRRLLLDRLTHALHVAARNGNCGALLFIDLDNFKSLNDTLGHDKGDELLQQVAARLGPVVRSSNTVARLGGDEFVILLEDLSEDVLEAAAQAEVVAEKALRCFNQPFKFSAFEHHCTPSIGVAMFDQAHLGTEDLLKRADVAMYQAKAAGRNTVCFFDQQMQLLVNTRVAIDRELRSSLSRGNFTVHYQRQADINGATVGAEALVRWNHPRRGLLYPADFIAFAEESGLIIHLGHWVMEVVCAQIAAWDEDGGTPWRRVSVNVSAKQFRQPDFVPKTLAILAKAGIDPGAVKLELTESSLVDHPEDTIAKMTALKSQGLAFSLDDFGTGYSSLSYLKRLPLDELKIDKAFVKDIMTDGDDAAIAHTIVSLGQILGLEVVAEGVETVGQRDALAEYGCTKYQGYLISRPVPAASVFN